MRQYLLRPFQPISVSPPWPLWSTSNWGIRCKLPSWAPANCLNVKRSMDWSNRGTSKMMAPTGFFIKTALSTELWSLGILKARHKFAHGVDSLSTPKAENGNRDDYFIWWHVRFLIPPSKQRQREDWTGILCLDLIQEISDEMCNTGTEMLSSKNAGPKAFHILRHINGDLKCLSFDSPCFSAETDEILNLYSFDMSLITFLHVISTTFFVCSYNMLIRWLC